MRQILSLVFTPIGIFCFFIALALIFKKFGRIRAYRIILAVTCIWLLVITTKFIPDLMVNSLESQYQSYKVSQNPGERGESDILILGAGFSDDPSLPPNDQLENSTLARLCEGLRIHHILPDSRIICGGIIEHLTFKQSEAVSLAAVGLGVDPSNVETFDITSNNTEGEVKGYIRKYGDARKLILVTDAIHIPRAMMLFRKHGIEPVPAPANHILKHGSYQSPFCWLPSITNITKMNAALHEYLGILWIKLGGG